MPKVFVGIGAAILVAIVAWILWPSPYAKVRNLMSPGTAVIAFGDSLTAGYGAQQGEDYPSVLSRLIHVPVVNAGVSGDTTETALARIDQDVLTRDPRIVIVGLGGNDFLRGVPIATTEANLRTIVQKIEGANAMVVLLAFRFPSLNENYEEMYARVGKDAQCLVIKGVLSGILTDPTLKSDTIHPNARGYAKMADRIASPMNKLLRKANASLGR
jgi:acyl-CoA thioesterase I